MTRWNPDTLARAWAFATHHHRSQTYGGQADGERVPYMSHIGSVAMEVMAAVPSDASMDADLALQCAVLHDTIEDTAATFALIETEFGQAVADGVQALTKDERLPGKPAQMSDSLARIRRQPREIWMVKLADRIANLYAPPYYWDDAKILAYQDEARLIHRELAGASDVLAARLLAKIGGYGRRL